MPVNQPSERPEHLPDFASPPLNEVVLGVQFVPPVGYQQIRAGEIWGLFKAEYPRVQEQAPLPPSFETFGLPHQSIAMPPITFLSGATHNRFWFLNPDGSELVQFQQDRLLHNWRKVGDGLNEYPRFETMIAKFRDELTQLQDYMSSLVSGQALSINQCEVNYINHLQLNRADGEKFSDWLAFLGFTKSDPDDFGVTFRKIIRNPDGQPIGRLQTDAALAYLPDGREIISLSLVVRGAPNGSYVESAIDFLRIGREIIVNSFAEFTTDSAHKKWERIK